MEREENSRSKLRSRSLSLISPGRTHLHGLRRGQGSCLISDEAFSRSFPWAVKARKLSTVISRIFILPFTSSHRDNDWVQTWVSPDLSIVRGTKKRPTSLKRTRDNRQTAPDLLDPLKQGNHQTLQSRISYVLSTCSDAVQITKHSGGSLPGVFVA